MNPYLKKAKLKLLKPIILQHGFTGTSEEFLMSKKGFINENGVYVEDFNQLNDCRNRFGKTLSYVLSACGYDVWLSNVRGNKYSTNHTFLDTNDPEFWKFSLDELSAIDLPALIDYVSTVANVSKVGYVGYSMGTSLMFQLMSAQPEYSKVVDPFVAMAPVVYMGRIPKTFLKFKTWYPFFRMFPNRLIKYSIVRKMFVSFFHNHDLSSRSEYVNELSAHTMDQTSTVVMAHFLQRMAFNNFARFDWGLFDNYRHYASPKPPDYPLANITSDKIALIQASKSDVFSDIRDLDRLKSELRVKPMLDYWIPDKHWVHADYLFDERLDKYVVSVILRLLQRSH